MHPFDWPKTVKALYDKATDAYAQGVRSPRRLFTKEEQALLASIGARPIEMFDYVEDAWALEWETALLIIAVRRDYFLTVQNAEWMEVSTEEPPARDEELGGIPWLPRLIFKAEARLRGILPENLMYGCGGDRSFFKKYHLHPADFLRYVWAARGDHQKILDYVRQAEAHEGRWRELGSR